MKDRLQFYIDGRWVEPAAGARPFTVINPATEEPIARIALGSAKDVDLAVAAARRAFTTYSQTTREQRIDLLKAIIAAYQARYDEIAETISLEMGAPLWLAKAAQAAMGPAHFTQMIEVLGRYQFEEQHGTTLIRREPIGVCGLITPWNWPINQIACKVAPALAAGCTMVLKPTEIAPMNAILFTEILHTAGVPAGVFNLVNGDGPTVGHAIAEHPGVDMVSFTGSTRAGIEVARAAAPTVKRVAQELGGKSANIILDDADFASAVGGGTMGCAMNSGQSCNAPTRMLVPRSRHDEAVAIAKATAESITVGDPAAATTRIGPVVSEAQWKKIQGLIKKGIDEGATLVTGGPGRPDGLSRGYYVRPTVFANVRNDMAIAREEIFGPVLSILPYDTDEDAIRIANDTAYGLAGYVSSGNLERARKVASRIRAGQISVNGATPDFSAPFGGFKQSGIGRELGPEGIAPFTEYRSIILPPRA
jgi:aldehyde dehydrogenase (NAD+)